MAITRSYNVELAPDSFRRLNENHIETFYKQLDTSVRFETIGPVAVRPVLRALVSEEHPAILDLMAGSDSHIDSGTAPSRLVGLGMCEPAMARNSALSERIVHDLDNDPTLPFADGSFDVVLCSGALPYLKRPLDVINQAARVLKPGGLILVIFDNLAEEDRATKIWRRSSDDERLAVVDHMIDATRAFGRPQVRVSKLRSNDEGSGGRPLFTVFATRSGAVSSTNRDTAFAPPVEHRYSKEEIAARKKQVGQTLRCPYCDHRLTKIGVPDVPFCEWDAEFLHVCFAPDCPFTLRSLSVMGAQGNMGVSYRVAYHQERDQVYTVPDASFCDAG